MKILKIATFFGSLTLILSACIPTPTPTLTLTPAPALTLTPAPALTLTPTSPPVAHIIAPTDGQLVKINEKVTFEYSNVPTDQHLWLVVRIPGIGAPWLIYPQVQGMGPDQKSNGVSEIWAAFGGKNDSGGRPFNIVVLLADDEANSKFVDYAYKCKLDSNLCNGMLKPDKGVEILDFDTVIRQ